MQPHHEPYSAELLRELRCVNAAEVDALCERIRQANDRRRRRIEQTRQPAHPFWLGLGALTTATYALGEHKPGRVHSGIKLNAALVTPDPTSTLASIRRIHADPDIRALDAITASTPPKANTHAGIITADQLSPDELAEFMRAGGWHIRKAGTTGNPPGRQPQGLRSIDPIRNQLEDTGHTLETLTASIRAGRHRTPEQQAAYDKLALWTHRHGRVNKIALAATLNCSRDTTYELAKRGKDIGQMHEERIQRLEEALIMIGQLGVRLAQMFPTNPFVTATVDKLLADIYQEAEDLAQAA